MERPQETLGGLLREWREERGLSLGALAARASVAKATLSRWQSGASQPRVNELLAVLDALEKTREQREQALALIPAPRARRELRRAQEEDAARSGAGSPPAPVLGRLVRAMRYRRGFTLERVAVALRVTTSTVSRWERGEIEPTADRLGTLCDLLGAQSAERAAVLSGSALLAPWPEAAGFSEEGLSKELDLLIAIASRGDRALFYLTFLDWEARAWELVRRREAPQWLLVRGWSRVAERLTWDGRFAEAKAYGDRVLQAARTVRPVSSEVLLDARGALHVAALVRNRPGTARSAASVVEFLQEWLTFSTDSAWTAHVCREMAQAASTGGWTDEALNFSRDARRRAARQDADTRLRRLCDLVHAETLTRAGRPAEAIRYLDFVPTEIPLRRILDALQLADALLALGDRRAADEWLRRASGLVEAHGYPDFRPRIETLQRSL